MARWLTEKDKQFIKDNWSTMSNLEIADTLGVHSVTICAKGREMGLPKKKELLSGKRTQTSSRIENYELSSETLLEIRARERMKELLKISNSFNLREKIRIKAIETITKSAVNIIEGTVISKTDKLVTIQNGQYPVSFAYVEFYIGKAVII